MKMLETNFAGLTLKNPFIVSSCNLTNSAEKNRRWEEAGAGAVVLKSLFEEEIEAESGWVQEGTHTEEQDYLFAYYRAHRLDEYLQLIKESKKLCTIPVIASINCFRPTGWTDFATQIEEAGADALELNVMSVCADLEYNYGAYEQLHLDILREVKKVVSIPVIVKLGRHFTNCIPLIHQLYANGASAVVLFNRMAAPDININTLSYANAEALGHSSDLHESLRWIGLASNRVPKLSYAASGGVVNGESMVKALLAGASAVEVCSVLYRRGAEPVQEMLRFLQEWMTQKGYESLNDFKGLMNAKKQGSAAAFERSQFFKQFGKYE
ncbi:MAG: dihydroorotate dehydrogenase-like protein [Bacteroides sp.]|nr:dihydroorotate dehydrogenase-like protein [Bacteroides sp.]